MQKRFARPGPIYLQVADELESAIARRPPGTELPSENELARTHRVSRLTARASLDELERRYLVHRTQGKRTLVSRRIPYRIGPDRTPSWSESVRASGATPRSQTVRLQLRNPPRAIRALLQLGPNRRALFLSRIRFVDDEIAACADTWLVPELVPMFAERMQHDASLHETLARTFDLAPVRSWSQAEFIFAPASIAERLGKEGRPMVLKLTGVSSSKKLGRPIETTTSWLRADVFNIVFEMGVPE